MFFKMALARKWTSGSVINQEAAEVNRHWSRVIYVLLLNTAMFVWMECHLVVEFSETSDKRDPFMLTWDQCVICVITDHSKRAKGETGLRSADKSDFYGKAFSHRTGSSSLLVVVVDADGLGKTK